MKKGISNALLVMSLFATSFASAGVGQVGSANTNENQIERCSVFIKRPPMKMPSQKEFDIETEQRSIVSKALIKNGFKLVGHESSANIILKFSTTSDYETWATIILTETSTGYEKDFSATDYAIFLPASEMDALRKVVKDLPVCR